MTSLESAVRSTLLTAPEVIRLTSLRRSTSLFSQGQDADFLYFIESGLVKIARRNVDGDRVILTIRGPGDLAGEEALADNPRTYCGEADILAPADVFRIPRDVAARAIADKPEFVHPLVGYLLGRRIALAEKVELLCLRDVEYRILHYLADLAVIVSVSGEDGYQLPITQLELADLVGATRETTSTTLNQLERRGLVKLSRRMLTIPSLERIRHEAHVGSPMETIPSEGII